MVRKKISIRRRKIGFKNWWDRDCMRRKRSAKVLLRMEERKDRKRQIFGRKRKVKKIYGGEAERKKGKGGEETKGD